MFFIETQCRTTQNNLMSVVSFDHSWSKKSKPQNQINYFSTKRTTEVATIFWKSIYRFREIMLTEKHTETECY